MRAGELLSKTTDHASPAAVASGLLALTRLDRADLAVALLVDLWDCGQQGAWAAPGGSPPARVSNETAILVLDAALTCDDSHAQLVAAGLLCRNAFRLDICGPLNWPPSIDGAWDRHFGPKTKLLLVDALVQHALHSKEREAALRSLAVRLYAISRADPDKHVRGCIGQLLAVVVPKIRKLENGGTIMQGSLEVTKRQLERAVRRAHDNPDRLLGEMTQERAASLDDWARKCSLAKPDASPGALACAPILPAAEALTEG